MPSGGARPGAGRKAGACWKSSKPEPMGDLAKSRVREILTTAADPLAVLVEIAGDVKAGLPLRVQAATAACPYLYPRLSAAVVATVPAGDQNHDSAALVDRIMGRIARMVPVIEGAADRQEVTV